MIGVVSARGAPALPDLRARPFQHLLIRSALPLHEVLDDPEKPLAFFLLRFLRSEDVGMARRVVHHLGKDHRTCGGKRPLGPPLVNCGWVAAINEALPRRGLVDGLERQRHLDELLARDGHCGRGQIG